MSVGISILACMHEGHGSQCMQPQSKVGSLDKNVKCVRDMGDK